MKPTFKKSLSSLIIAGAAAFLSQSAYSADPWSTVQGKISTIEVTEGQNYGFRVYLAGAPIVCNSYNWGYVNENDTNYKTYVAALLTAKAQQSNVTLYTSKDATTGYCHLAYISISN
jgi:hypothetical protein